MAAARWLLLPLLAVARLGSAEFPDLTLVLQPDEELDWNQITRWMEQSRFSVEAGSQHHVLPPTPVETSPPGSNRHGQHAERGGSDTPAGVSVTPAAGVGDDPHPVSAGPAPEPDRPTQLVPGPALVPGGTKSVVPGPVLVPDGPRSVVPGPALVPGASPGVSRSAPAPGLPTFRPTWRPVRPGPALLPSSPLAGWKPQWAELRPGSPLVPRPPPALAGESQPALPRPTFPELHSGESLLPADAPGGYQPEPFAEPSPAPAPTAAAESPESAAADQQPLSDQPALPSVASADFQHLLPLTSRSGPLPPDERERYRPPPDIDDYDQQPPPAQLNMAARPPPPGQLEPDQQPQSHSDQQPQDHSDQQRRQPAEGSLRRPPQAGRHTERSVPDDQLPQSPHRGTGYTSPETQQPAGPGGRVAPGTADASPGLEQQQQQQPGPRLLTQERPPSAVTEQRQAVPVGGGGQLPPETLAVLLQRLEERLVAGETQQQRQNTELRAVQHSQRKAEVVAREDMVAIRSEFRDLNAKMDNLRADLGRVTTLLETVMTEVQGARRTLREQAAQLPAAQQQQQPAAAGQLAELGRKLGQLVVNTELLKGGQRRLGGTVRNIQNRTSELSERSEQFATKGSLATGLSEMRTYLDKQNRASAVPVSVSKEDEALPKDCSDVLLSGGSGSQSGIYQVRPRQATQPIFVYCDQETDGGGWAVIQRRTNGDEDFFRDWISYKYGFGNLAGEFWLGNENIYLLTNHRLNELRVDLADFPRQRPGFDDYPGSNATAHYGAFALGSETEGYPLKVLDNYSGDAGDSLKYHAGMQFSTKDLDNDLWKEDSCAANHKGGWWYKGCDSSNLNGLYLSGPVPSQFEYQVAYWYDWRGPRYSLYHTQMMVRPADHTQRAADTRRRGSGRVAEEGKTAAQRRLGTQTVRGRSRRRRRRRRRQRKQGQ